MLRHWFFSHPLVHLKAVWEATFVIGCGLLAFPSLLFIRAVQRAATSSALPTLTLWDTVKSGQLFPFSFGVAGLILWLVSQEFRGKGLPLRSLLILLLFITSATCIIVYAIQPSMNHELPEGVIYTSEGILILYYLLHYYLIVVREMPVLDVASGVKAGATAMISRAKSRRGGGRP